ncbi:hypothetical protein Hanom_Chr03g00193601 [Helianthus anomalus]
MKSRSVDNRTNRDDKPTMAAYFIGCHVKPHEHPCRPAKMWAISILLNFTQTH